MRTARKFGETKIKISTQFYENYSDTNIPHWKSKGEQVFELFVCDAILMYEEEMLTRALVDYIAAQEDGHSKYTYLSHEPVFGTPHVLDPDKFHSHVESYWPSVEDDRTPQEQMSDFVEMGKESM